MVSKEECVWCYYYGENHVDNDSLEEYQRECKRGNKGLSDF